MFGCILGVGSAISHTPVVAAALHSPVSTSILSHTVTVLTEEVDGLFGSVSTVINRVLEELFRFLKQFFAEKGTYYAEDHSQEIAQDETNFRPLVQNHSNIKPSAPPMRPEELGALSQKSGFPGTLTTDACYFDMGGFSSYLWPFLNWSTNPPTFNMQAFTYTLTGVNTQTGEVNQNCLFPQLKAAGIDQLNLAFAQIGSIDYLDNPIGASSAYDAIAQMLQYFPTAFQAFIDEAKNAGMTIDLSMGGEDAIGATICDRSLGETPTTQANKLVQFMIDHHIDTIDFDLENTLLVTSNTPADVVEFFQALHTGLHNCGKMMGLTIEAGISDWAKKNAGQLDMLFYDKQGSMIFFNLFDDLYLMPYSIQQFYLDAENYNNCGWSIEGWLDIIGKENAGKLHIGFEDAVNYADPNASASGYHYDLTGINDPGTAAAAIQQQLQAKLIADGYTVSLGKSYFWPDFNRHASGQGIYSRYQIFSDGTMNFATDVMQAYINKMNGI